MSVNGEAEDAITEMPVANSNRLGQDRPLLSQYQSGGTEDHGSQGNHNDTSHPPITGRIAHEQAANHKLRSKGVEENKRQVDRDIHRRVALAERLERFLRR